MHRIYIVYIYNVCMYRCLNPPAVSSLHLKLPTMAIDYGQDEVEVSQSNNIYYYI